MPDAANAGSFSDKDLKAFEKGFLIRTTGDTIALSPPLIITREEIDTLFSTLRAVLHEI